MIVLSEQRLWEENSNKANILSSWFHRDMTALILCVGRVKGDQKIWSDILTFWFIAAPSLSDVFCVVCY